MTTANEIAEIRQRNNNGYELWNDGEGGAFIDMQVYDDLAALLAIVDELTARAEAAEAALWDIANAYGFPRGIEWENDPLFIHGYVQRVIATWVNLEAMRTQDKS